MIFKYKGTQVSVNSLPFVELLGSLDAFKSPKVVGVQVHAFRIATTKSFSDPGVVKSLSIAELEIACEKSETKSEYESASSASVVSVEVEG